SPFASPALPGWPFLRILKRGSFNCFPHFNFPFSLFTRISHGNCPSTPPKRVSRPVEFCLPLCHATNREFSNDAREKSCWQPAHYTGEEKPARRTPGGALAAVAANRNTCQFKNSRNALKT